MSKAASVVRAIVIGKLSVYLTGHSYLHGKAASEDNISDKCRFAKKLTVILK